MFGADSFGSFPIGSTNNSSNSTISIVKTLTYYVKAEATAINKNLVYYLSSESGNITKSLYYTIATRTNIGKQLSYALEAAQNITKGLTYYLAFKTQIGKALYYALVDRHKDTPTLDILERSIFVNSSDQKSDIISEDTVITMNSLDLESSIDSFGDNPQLTIVD